MKPIRMYIFGTKWIDFYGAAIWFAQGRKWPAHVGCYFVMEDGSHVGFQAQHKVDGMKFGGFVEFDFAEYQKKYHGWKARLTGKKMWVMYVNMPDEKLLAKFLKCKQLERDVLGYAHTQVFGKLIHERLGFPMQRDPRYVDCSESMAMVLAEETPEYDVRDNENVNFDSVSPFELWGAMENKSCHK